MKFHLYEVNGGGRIQDKIVQYWQLPMEKRERGLYPDNTKIIALERCEGGVSYSGIEGMFLVDMMEAREDHFPGRYTAGHASEKKNEDLPLEEGDKISQQTMALYIPGKRQNYLICQYNHYGVKASLIAYYFSDETDILEPVVKDDIMKRFRDAEKVVYFRMKINVSQVDKPLREAARRSAKENMALTSFITMANDAEQHSNARDVDITISHTKSRNQGALKDTQNIPEEFLNHGSVEKMEAGIKQTSDHKTEVLDLLNHREVYEVKDRYLSKTTGMRYEYESRRHAILESISHFKPYIKD